MSSRSKEPERRQLAHSDEELNALIEKYDKEVIEKYEKEKEIAASRAYKHKRCSSQTWRAAWSGARITGKNVHELCTPCCESPLLYYA
jgi:hypothetical protein